MSRARRPRHPTVGYGHPPEAQRFTPGQSGNPRGRPKGTTSKTLTPPLDPLAQIVLDEAARLIPVRDGDRTVTVSMQQAIIRRLCVAAVKGEPRAQRLFFKALALSEAQAREETQRAAEPVLEPILTIRRIIVDPKDPSARHDSETDA